MSASTAGYVDGLILEHQPLLRRVALRFVRAGRGMISRDDLLAHLQVRLAELAAAYDSSTGVPFAGYAWPNLCGAARDLARRERREIVKMHRAICQLPRETYLTPELDTNLGGPRERAEDFVGQAFAAAALGLVSEDSARTAANSNTEARHGVRQALDQLPASTRRVLVERFVEERTIGEVAVRVGVHPASLRREQAEGLRRLGRLLEQKPR